MELEHENAQAKKVVVLYFCVVFNGRYRRKNDEHNEEQGTEDRGFYWDRVTCVKSPVNMKMFNIFYSFS